MSFVDDAMKQIVKYFYRFEYVYYNLSYSYNNECTNLSELKSKLRSISMKYFYNFKSYKIFSCIFNKSDILELKTFGNNKDIIVTRPDKGRGVVIVDRCVYINKMLGIISDRQKFNERKDSIQSYSTRIEDKVL